jgi:hypothetical protein
MATARERLADLLDALPDDQVVTVLAFAEAVSRGRAVVSVCDVPATTELRSTSEESTQQASPSAC